MLGGEAIENVIRVFSPEPHCLYRIATDTYTMRLIIVTTVSSLFLVSAAFDHTAIAHRAVPGCSAQSIQDNCTSKGQQPGMPQQMPLIVFNGVTSHSFCSVVAALQRMCRRSDDKMRQFSGCKNQAKRCVILIFPARETSLITTHCNLQCHSLRRIMLFSSTVLQ